MKKVIILILALILCLSLCACNFESSGLSRKEKALVGTWLDSDHNPALHLLPSGNWVVCGSFDAASEMAGTYRSGTWEVADGYLIFHRVDEDLGTTANVWKILSNDRIASGANNRFEYTKE